jgi:hypothetical protein
MASKTATQDKLTIYVPTDLAERIRNAVAHLAGAPLFLSMSAFGEAALRIAVEGLEREHNNGRPFGRPQGGTRRPGRPVGT